MLTSLSPVGERSRKQRWWLTASAYLAASATGGAVVGGLLAAVGLPVASRLAPHHALALLGAAALTGVLVEAHPGLTLPAWRRQVDERWLSTYRGWVYGAGYGFQLGTGVATIVPTSLTYVVWASALLSGSVAAGVGVGAVFGTSRALPLLALRSVRSPAALRGLARRLDRVRHGASLATRAVQAAAGLAALAVAA